MTAALMTFAANKTEKRKYIQLIPQLARSLHISDNQCMEYAKYFLSHPKYVLSEPCGDPRDEITDQEYQQLRNLFVAEEPYVPEQKLQTAKNWTKINANFIGDLTGDNQIWNDFVKFLETGGTISEAKKLRERLRQAGEDATKYQ